jgi:hypothetical protein
VAHVASGAATLSFAALCGDHRMSFSFIHHLLPSGPCCLSAWQHFCKTYRGAIPWAVVKRRQQRYLQPSCPYRAVTVC